MVTKLKRNNLRLRSFYEIEMRYEEDDTHSALYCLQPYIQVNLVVFSYIYIQAILVIIHYIYIQDILLVINYITINPDYPCCN